MGRIKAEEGVTLIDSVNSMWNDTHFQGFGISSAVLIYVEYGGTFLESSLSAPCEDRIRPMKEISTPPADKCLRLTLLSIKSTSNDVYPPRVPSLSLTPLYTTGYYPQAGAVSPRAHSAPALFNPIALRE